ncbi:PREDICTED: matrix metalloproteinase-9-like [Thamnophis sirtalis]|uniref:Matrix metalloproteinase-9-like n=1 Tax=Thamnophis sirtalis TaxID=35019 RepID=A0A6I9Z0Q7_9SAUR|nr:PREDICTED: matrix metalloproteinase-9-like [Thamnophis sirtalis]
MNEYLAESFLNSGIVLVLVPPPCVFPFFYHGKVYNSCTENASKNHPWCATTANYDHSKQWKYYVSKEYGGNSGGKQCAFPFTYKKRTYYSCTNEDAEIGRFWCATTGSYDKDKQWSYCADTSKITFGGPRPSVFDRTKSRSSSELKCLECLLDKIKVHLNIKTTFFFIFIFPISTEYEGNSKGKSCVFPFIYNGKTFTSCTNQNSEDGRFWCSVTRNYDKHRQWSYCADTRL